MLGLWNVHTMYMLGNIIINIHHRYVNDQSVEERADECMALAEIDSGQNRWDAMDGMFLLLEDLCFFADGGEDEGVAADLPA